MPPAMPPAAPTAPIATTASLRVALCGNPNTGKTTLFNRLTGANAHIGNYPGVTVEQRSGRHQGPQQPWIVADLPGCYSLTAHSPEEEIAFRALHGDHGPAPHVVVVVADATNLARNLFLAMQVAEQGVPMVLALNLMDAAEAAGWQIDLAALAQAVRCPVVPMAARSGRGIDALRLAVEEVAQRPQQGSGPAPQWSVEVQGAIARCRGLHPRLAAARDGEVVWFLAAAPELADALEPELGRQLAAAFPRDRADADVRRQIIHDRYRWIDSWVGQCVRPPAQPRTRSDRVDDVLLHPWWGSLLFLLAMAALFQAVFAWATPMADAVNALMGAVTDACKNALPAGATRDALTDGFLAGVGGTLVFLPQILVLFFGIAVLEDSGYLARAAFLVDRLMARAGLPGKAFVPLLSSYACAVPGIMAARTLGDPRDRLLTILIAPLMSCSARLPVYTMVTAAVFAGVPPVAGVLAFGGLVVAAMYVLGFAFALVAAWALRRTLLPGQGAPLVLEMPPYRWPRPANLLRVLWDRGRLFVTETGSTIVALSVVLWALMSFPQRADDEARHAEQLVRAETMAAADKTTALAEADRQATRARLEHSAAGQFGRAIEPAIAPLGFDWRIGIGLVGSLAAREVLIPVMAQIYGKSAQSDVDDAFAADVGKTMASAGALTPLKGLSLMVFFAIAMQCLNTLAAMRRETRSWKWPLFALVYLNVAAWLASLAVYQIGKALGYA